MRRSLQFVALAGAVALSPTAQPRGAGNGSEWAAYAADNGGSKYSPLDQINKDTVQNLRIAWRQSALPGDLATLGAKVKPANFENTPVMIGGLLYVGTALGTVSALDPATGKVVWLEELPQDALTPTSALGTGARGVAHWGEGNSTRILSVRGRWLVALDARTGKRVAQFGDGGQVDLATGYDRAARNYSWRSIPVVVGDVIVVGGLSGAGPASGDVRGFDARTGKQLWTFHVIPRPGEFGNDSWEKDSWEQGTAAGVWGLMSADEELGYVYLPTESSASHGGGDYYGKHRPGNGLFAESLICLDAKTGKRVWHFQMVHHGLWDFDLGAAPNLVDITVDGRRIKAVAQVSKQNFVYVFDRVTGKPVWPIEERPVPKGDMPDEWYSPTQPVPTKPPAYDQQGATIDDLIDFTPELRQEAIQILNRYRYGSLFEPPSMADPRPGGKQGTARIPGTVANVWNGAGVDPETGILYVPSVHCPVVIEMVKPTAPNSPTEFTNKQGAPPPGAAFLEGPIVGPWLQGPQGLPLFKPPYGRLVAIDLNKGEILWTAANGDGPRDHPAINNLNLPPLGQPGRVAPMITRTLVFLGEGGNGGGILALPPWGGGKKFRAYDKSSGAVVWEMALPGGTIGAPMTYMVDGTQYIVVAVGWKDMAPELIALALPKA
jgi:quinoprotein glucose dehydrogenase